MPFGPTLLDIFFQHASSYMEFDLIFKLVEVLCGVAIVLMERTVSYLVHMGPWVVGLGLLR